MKVKSKKRIIIGTIIAIVLMILLLPYYKVERLTMLYGKQFENSYELTGMIDRVKYLKVFDYEEDAAEVYYVGEGHTFGIKLYLVKKDGQWVLDYWEAIWSTSGSADSFVWPYYR